MDLFFYEKKYKDLSDDELRLELVRLCNDSYLLVSEAQQKMFDYQLRHLALWAELERRGLCYKEDNQC